MFATPTLLPIRPTTHATRQTSNSNLKRRYDSPPQSPTMSSYTCDSMSKRRRNPVNLPSADTYINLSTLGPPTFESKNPRFAPMGSLTTSTYGYQSTATIPQTGQTLNSLATATGTPPQPANPYATPISTPTQHYEDVDMMDMEMNEAPVCQLQSGMYDGHSGMTQHQTVRSRDITPIPSDVNERAREMIKKGKLKLLMGYRADCDRCQRREPGHSTHLVYSDQ